MEVFLFFLIIFAVITSRAYKEIKKQMAGKGGGDGGSSLAGFLKEMQRQIEAQAAKAREQGGGDREQGGGDREQGGGDREQGGDAREQGGMGPSQWEALMEADAQMDRSAGPLPEPGPETPPPLPRPRPAPLPDRVLTPATRRPPVQGGMRWTQGSVRLERTPEAVPDQGPSASRRRPPEAVPARPVSRPHHEPGAPVPAITRRRAGYARMNARHMRKVVVWSEIIAPPVGLRKE